VNENIITKKTKSAVQQLQHKNFSAFSVR